MTQADVPAHAAPVAVADTDDSDHFSIESIGWLFIQKYYSTYTGDIAKLFAFYDADASLLHDEFASESPESAPSTQTVHLAAGTDAIKKHFSAQADLAETNKIVVERADFQKSVGDSILIVVCGLWKRGTALLLQFVQTFVLKCKGKTVYDILNDLLKFVNLSELFSNPDVKEVEVDEVNGNGSVDHPDTVKQNDPPAAKPEESKPAEPETAEKAEKADDDQKPAIAEKAPAAPQAEAAAAPAEVKAESPAAPAAPAQTAQSTTETPASLPAQPSLPAQRPTWANLAAIEPKVAKTQAVSSPPTAKSAPAPPKKSASPSQTVQPAQANNGKFKKEEWYPIYIRNIEVEDDELRNALVKQFGDIKFFKRSNKAALCDFRNKEGQQKALEAKEIVVNGNAILLEPRLHKPFNGKPEFKKEKKQVKKNGAKKF